MIALLNIYPGNKTAIVIFIEGTPMEENPPYFSRLFKKEVGMSPKEFMRMHPYGKNQIMN